MIKMEHKIDELYLFNKTEVDTFDKNWKKTSKANKRPESIKERIAIVRIMNLPDIMQSIDQVRCELVRHWTLL